MHISTTAHREDFPKYFEVFERALGGRPWHRVAVQVKREIRGNPFLEGWLRDQHRVVFGLEEISEFWDRHGHMSYPIDSSVGLFEASVLVTLFWQIQSSAHAAQVASLTGRITGGMKNAVDLRALMFEFQMLTHFARRGYEVHLPEADQRVAVDGIVSKDGVRYEIECKLVTGDKGRQIHRRDALEIHHLLKLRLGNMVDSLNEGLLVRITFEGRPSRRFNDRLQLVKDVRSCILQAKNGVFDGFRVEVVDFAIAKTPFDSRARPSQGVVEDFLRAKGVVNRESMVIGRPGANALIFSLESDQPDRLLDETFKVIADAARRQLTGSKPAFIFVKFASLNADQMESLGAEVDAQPTALQQYASRFLDSAAATNVSVLAFLADGPLKRLEDNSVTRDGVSYFFRNEGNAYKADVENISVFGSKDIQS